jgi:hypothetical protein
LIAQQERDEIEEVVRQVLDSLGGDKPSPLWSGNAGAFFAIRSLAPSDWRVKSAATRVELLEVSSVAGDRATVRLKAGVFPTLVHPIFGERHAKLRVTGPAELERSRDGWKLLTLAIDGVDVATCFFTPFPAEAAIGDVRIAAVARSLARNDELTVAVRNEGRRAAELDSVFAGGRVWLLFEDGGLLLRQRTLEPGEVTARSVGMKGRFRDEPMQVRVRVDGREAALELQRPKLSVGQRLRQMVRDDVLVQASLAAVVLAWLAGLVPAVIPAIFLLAAGLLLVLGECLSFLRGTRVSAQPFYAAVGLAELVAAAAIFGHEQVGIITPGAVAATLVAAHITRFQAEVRRRAHN